MSFTAWLSVAFGVATFLFWGLWRGAVSGARADRQRLALSDATIKEQAKTITEERLRYEETARLAKQRANECTANIETAIRAGVDGPEAAKSALVDYVDGLFSLSTSSTKNNNEGGS